MAIVPTGSGNGLARELGISLRPERAIATATRGIDHTIDVGELGGRLFVNLAGVGLDASVASLFDRLTGRGWPRYVQATLSTVFSYIAEAYTITVGGETFEDRALIVALANGRQYGNGAVIAPHAKLDDGLLDLVLVGPLSALQVLGAVRRLFQRHDRPGAGSPHADVAQHHHLRRAADPVSRRRRSCAGHRVADGHRALRRASHQGARIVAEEDRRKEIASRCSAVSNSDHAGNAGPTSPRRSTLRSTARSTLAQGHCPRTRPGDRTSFPGARSTLRPATTRRRRDLRTTPARPVPV